MAKNPIQFQKGLSLPDFLASYRTEGQCKQWVLILTGRVHLLVLNVGLLNIANSNVKLYINVINAGLPCFNGVNGASIHHASYSKSGKRLEQYEHIFHWVNTMIGNVKNSIRRTSHAIREQHIPRYLGEFREFKSEVQCSLCSFK